MAIGLTLNDYSLTWDEPTYLDQTLEYLDYFQSLGRRPSLFMVGSPCPFRNQRSPSSASPLSRSSLPRCFSGLASTHRRSDGDCGALFSILLAVVYLWGRRRLSRPAAIGSSLLLLAMPRFFAHSHLFALDLAIAFWWTTVLWALL